MEKQQSDEAREIRAQARRFAVEANNLPIEAGLRVDRESTAKWSVLYEFAKWLELYGSMPLPAFLILIRQFRTLLLLRSTRASGRRDRQTNP